MDRSISEGKKGRFGFDCSQQSQASYVSPLHASPVEGIDWGCEERIPGDLAVAGGGGRWARLEIYKNDTCSGGQTDGPARAGSLVRPASKSVSAHGSGS